MVQENLSQENLLLLLLLLHPSFLSLLLFLLKHEDVGHDNEGHDNVDHDNVGHD